MAVSRFPVLLFTLALVLAACGDEPAAVPLADPDTGCVEDFEEGVDYFPDKITFDEAAGVSVSYHDHYKVVEVTPPHADGAVVRYVLVQCGTPEPDVEGDTVTYTVEVPAREVVTLTTTNLPHFAELGMVDRLAGVGTGAYVTTEAVRERIDAGELEDFADAGGQPDIERIAVADADLLIIDGFGDTVLDDVDRLARTGVPTAINADFNEHTLLGRAEWLKFTALFLNAEAEANAAYEQIATRYRAIADRVADAEDRPTVLANTPYEGTWFMPGGASFLANAIADAGGDYTFADNDVTGALQLDIETVLDRAADADVWIQAGSVHGTLDDLLAIDERFAEFAAVQSNDVWAYDRWVTEEGGHAVFEVAYTRADLFLADLVTILHPDAIDDHDLTFFGRVGELA
jgi:iron complex transport system substrate-binding protein